jgi:hypothetical protein
MCIKDSENDDRVVGFDWVVGQISRFSRNMGFTRLIGGFFGSPSVISGSKNPWFVLI